MTSLEWHLFWTLKDGQNFHKFEDYVKETRVGRNNMIKDVETKKVV